VRVWIPRNRMRPRIRMSMAKASTFARPLPGGGKTHISCPWDVLFET
jgi:hypothetical protein